MLSLKKKSIQLLNNMKKPFFIATVILLLLYVASLVFWIDRFDWETASYITVFYGVIGVFFSLWQANAQRTERQKDTILLELSISEEVSNNSLLSMNIDEIDSNSPELLHKLKECMHLVNKISLLTKKGLINIEELYLISGSDLKGIVLRCIKVIAEFDYEIEFIAKDYILKYRQGLIDLYNEIKEMDGDILLLQDKVDYILGIDHNRLIIKRNKTII